MTNPTITKSNLVFATAADLLAYSPSANTVALVASTGQLYIYSGVLWIGLMQNSRYVYAAEFGNDTTGNGTEYNPYKTIIRAVQDVPVTTAAAPYVVKFSGTTSEGTLVIKRNMSIQGDTSSATRATFTSITLDAGWETSPGAEFSEFNNIEVVCFNISLTRTAPVSNFGGVSFVNSVVSGSLTTSKSPSIYWINSSNLLGVNTYQDTNLNEIESQIGIVIWINTTGATTFTYNSLGSPCTSSRTLTASSGGVGMVKFQVSPTSTTFSINGNNLTGSVDIASRSNMTVGSGSPTVLTVGTVPAENVSGSLTVDSINSNGNIQIDNSGGLYISTGTDGYQGSVTLGAAGKATVSTAAISASNFPHVTAQSQTVSPCGVLSKSPGVSFDVGTNNVLDSGVEVAWVILGDAP